MSIRIGDRIEFGTEAEPRGGVVVAVSAMNEVALVEWDAGGQTFIMADMIGLVDGQKGDGQPTAPG